MNEFLANLNVVDVKLHNFHYNVVGKDFKTTHLILEDEITYIHDTIDDVAERLKMLGKYPQASLKEYLASSTIAEVSSKDYTSTEIYKMLIEDYEKLISNIIEIRKEANDVTLSMLDDIQLNFETKLWFFKATIK